MQAKERTSSQNGRGRPLLMVDIDGVISLFGGWPEPGRRGGGEGRARPIDGALHSIDGALHFLSSTAAAHLLELSKLFDLVWASGWEERANEHLPQLLGLPRDIPFLRFARAVARSNAHWKLDAIEAYAEGRPLAWIDDAFNDACHGWASGRDAATLLVATDPQRGLGAHEAQQLAAWARALATTV